MEILKWIQQWYLGQCNGDWEHSFGIRIETLDNPGWCVSISIEETDVNNKLFQVVNIERNESDWIHSKIENDDEHNGLCFIGYGGPENFEEILVLFKTWVES